MRKTFMTLAASALLLVPAAAHAQAPQAPPPATTPAQGASPSTVSPAQPPPPATTPAQAPPAATPPQGPPPPEATPPPPPAAPPQGPSGLTPTPSAGSPDSPYTGGGEIGGLFSSVDGDEARYSRYRDLRNGAYTNLSLRRATDTFMFDANAYHIGYRDQQYGVSYTGAKLDVGFDFTGIPLNYSYITRTPYVRDGSTLTLDDAAQAAVQGPTFATNDGTAVGVPCAPGAPPASCSNPSLAAQVLATPSIYNYATEFDLRLLRNVARVGGTFNPSRSFDIDAIFTSSKRTGEQPWGASFAFNNAVELPKPVDDRTNDLNLGLSWGREKASIRVGYYGSWFTNQFHELVWDNPVFLNDYTNGLSPTSGPYDPSGYSNGNGAAHGREALAPDNNMQVASVTGLYRPWRRTSINGALQFTTQNQNDTLIPWTINSVINSPAVFAAFPNLAQNPRDTAEAKATGVNALLNFSTRASNLFGFNARYRYNERDVQTPIFDATQYVRFDAAPSQNDHGHSPQFDVSRNLLDATASFTPARFGTVRLGYSFENVQRDGRGFADVDEQILRATWDTYSSQFVSIRVSVENGWRRGTGFVEASSSADDTDIPTTGPGGTQPTLRYFDEADRDRLRGQVLLSVMPMETVDLYVQFAGGRDKYLPDDEVLVDTGRENELFGLQDTSVTSWNFGVNFNPNEHVSAGANYGYDTSSALQKSRNANPPPDPTWTDPSRDWTLDNDQHYTNVSLYADLLRLVPNTDLRFVYDLTNGDSSFVHGGPRVAGLQAAGQFIPLPDVINDWQQFRADAQYYFTQKIGAAFGYYFQKLDTRDFSVIDSSGSVGFAPATGEPRIDWLGVLLTGYGARPYTGHSVFVRLLYKF